MLRNYHCERKALRLETIIEQPEAALLHDPKTGRYYADMSDGTDEVYPLASADEFAEFCRYYLKEVTA